MPFDENCREELDESCREMSELVVLCRTQTTIIRCVEQTSYVVFMPTLSRTALLLSHIVLLPIDVHLTLPLGSGHRADLTFPRRN